ncbi:MAG: hypothetical protein K8W52_23180 [Deltaproteobacteria bacterium]|nr:hypothetical protein [Deltaproteobacteria bacterium]
MQSEGRSIALDRDALMEAAHGVARLVVRGGAIGGVAGVSAFAVQMALGWYGNGGWALAAWLLMPVFGGVAAVVGLYVGGVLGARRAAHALLRESGLLAAMVERVADAHDTAAEIAAMQRDDGDLRSKSPVAQRVKRVAYPMLARLAGEAGGVVGEAMPARVDAMAKAMIDRWGRVSIVVAVAVAVVVVAAPAAVAAIVGMI